MREYCFTYPVSQTSQDAHFYKRLLVEPLFVADDLDSNDTTIPVIHTSHNLTERSLAEHVNNFISIGKVVAKHDVVVATLIVVAVIARFILVDTGYRGDRPDNFLRIFCTSEVNAILVVIHDFSTFEDIQGTIAFMQYLLRAQWTAW